MATFSWNEQGGDFTRRADQAADWSEIDALCRKLSSLLDCHGHHKPLDLVGTRHLEQLSRAAVGHREAQAIRRPPRFLFDGHLAEDGEAFSP